MTSLSYWVSLENNFTLENCKMILSNSIDDCNVGFGTVIPTGASMMTSDNSHNEWEAHK